MRIWQRLSLVVLTLAVPSGFTWLVLSSREPVYQGKSISVWIEQYYQNFDGCMFQGVRDAAQRERAAVAIRQIGTNGIPYLMTLAAARDSGVKSFILRRAYGHPPGWLLNTFGLQRRYSRWAASSLIDPHKAYCGFMLLGPEAKAAVPDLISIMHTSPNRNGRRMATYCLGFIGASARDALPDLSENFKDPVDGVRDATVKALFDIGMNHETGMFRPECTRVLVPRLIQLLPDPKADALRIIRILGDIGPDAQAALPAIRPFSTSPNRDIRIAANRASERITGRMNRPSSE
jgi:HEAT repeat protein